MILPTRLILVMGIIIYFIVPIFLWFNKGKKSTKIIVDILFGVYLVVLFLGVTCRVSFDSVSTHIDFDYSGEWMSKKFNWSFSKIGGSDLIINLIMLIPIGLYVTFVSKNISCVSIIVSLVIGLMLGLGIELMQYALPVPRSPQITDILLNGCSVCFGALWGWVLNVITGFIKKK